MGYRCSPQAATGLSPYQLLHAVSPTIPPAIKDRFSEPVDLDNPEQAIQQYLERAALAKKYAVIAGDNLRIAQHRDTLRYAKLRDGGYLPMVRRFNVGDFVYLKRQHKAGLDIPAQPVILRVHEVRASGVLVLQGRCGGLTAVHLSQCAPCHLTNIDTNMELGLAPPAADAVCQECHSAGDEANLLVCDNCSQCQRARCCNPPLEQLPPRDRMWVCDSCKQQGVTEQLVSEIRAANWQRAVQQLHPEDYTPEQLRARALHGRLVKKTFKSPGPGSEVREYWGRVLFRGHGQGQNLLVIYEDGDWESCTLRTMARRGIRLQDEVVQLPVGVSIPDVAAAEQIQAVADELEPTPAAGAQQHTAGSLRAGASSSAAAGGSRRAELGPRGEATAEHQAEVTQQQSAQRHSHCRGVPKDAGAATEQHQAQPAAAYQTRAATRKQGLVGSALGDAGKVSSAIVGLSAAGHSRLQPLPLQWDLTQPQKLSEALQLLMPGTYTQAHLRRISNSIQQALQGAESGKAYMHVPTVVAEVQALLSQVDFSFCGKFLDPFAGTGTIGRCFSRVGYSVISNDLCQKWEVDSHEDALQPAFYEQQAAEAIITSPPFDQADLVVPLLAEMAAMVAVVHVSGSWISSPTAARQRWLQSLAAQGRVQVLLGLPRGPAGRRCAWVLIFKSSQLRAQMLSSCQSSLPISYLAAQQVG